MPLYVYENGEGNKIEELRLFKDRDRCPDGYKRVLNPQPISYTGTVSDPTDMRNSVLKGYYKHECKHGSRWSSEFSKNQIKTAWSN